MLIGVMEHYFNHKTILITGAASGIGRRFAERVSESDGVTLILWDLNASGLEETKKGCRNASEIVTTMVDITDSERIQFEADRLLKQGELPDIIVNCAGIVVGKFFHEHSYSDIDRSIQVNISGSMYVARAFLNEMIDRGSGHIVNLASASGYIGNPRMSVYAASKWAVLGWTESLQLEMRRNKSGIDVTAVIPSYIDTGMFKGVKPPKLVPLLTTNQIVEKMLKGISRRKKTIKAPMMVRTVPLLKALLPAAAFDWIAGSLLGVYQSMDSYTGRSEEE